MSVTLLMQDTSCMRHPCHCDRKHSQAELMLAAVFGHYLLGAWTLTILCECSMLLIRQNSVVCC
ncbi:hypothetical protein NP493_12g11043 [Ridgeia piscesae]|uniref:Uncharacterized protein n=1 Tax=Ridgeia piscesae TaxID=27915 RepID=A0AAD9UL45_RIDPI|nr:hypothetical protein NP493_12g11043 [Ridgeia piscesae]